MGSSDERLVDVLDGVHLDFTALGAFVHGVLLAAVVPEVAADTEESDDDTADDHGSLRRGIFGLFEHGFLGATFAFARGFGDFFSLLCAGVCFSDVLANGDFDLLALDLALAVFQADLRECCADRGVVGCNRVLLGLCDLITLCWLLVHDGPIGLGVFGFGFFSGSLVFRCFLSLFCFLRGFIGSCLGILGRIEESGSLEDGLGIGLARGSEGGQ